MLWNLLTGLLVTAAAPDFSAPLVAAGEKTAPSVATLTSDGQQLVLEVDVVDSTPSAAKDDIHSDHVEVWFGLEDPEALLPSRLLTTEPYGKLFTVRGKDDPKALDAIIQGTDPGSTSHTAQDGNCDQDRRSARESIGRAPSKRARALVGLSHLGFFPDGRAAVLYDKELYPGLSPALAPEDVRYEAKKTATGYHVRAVLQPGALLFVPREGVRSLRVRVDAIDAGGAKEVLRSTAPAPKWAEAQTLKSTPLAKPLTVKLADAVPELGAGTPVGPGAKEAFTALPSHFLRQGNTWMGLRVARESPEGVGLRACSVQLDAVTEYRPLTSTFGPSAAFLGTGTARVAVKSNDVAKALFLSRAPGDLRAALSDGPVETFRFKDGTPGFVETTTEPMMGRYTSGPCGAADTVTLKRVRLDKKGPQRTVLLTWNTCDADVIDGEDHILLQQPDEGVGQEPKYTWVTQGQKLRVRFGPEAVAELSWKPDGKGVFATAVPKP